VTPKQIMAKQPYSVAVHLESDKSHQCGMFDDLELEEGNAESVRPASGYRIEFRMVCCTSG